MGRSEITLTPEQERHIQDAVVNAEQINTWSILMPAVYQLVPGSQIANLWFSTIFPFDIKLIRQATIAKYPQFVQLLLNYDSSESGEVFSLLMVISTSLALGLLIGFAVSNNGERLLRYLSHKLGFDKILDEDSTVRDLQMAKYEYRKGLMSVGMDDDPVDRNAESVKFRCVSPAQKGKVGESVAATKELTSSTFIILSASSSAMPKDMFILLIYADERK